MAITNSVPTSFKQELFEGRHDFRTTGNTFKLALYTSSATMDSSTTAYSATNEVAGAGYVAGGSALVNINPTTSGTTGFTSWSNLAFVAVTVTARGALIYNSTVGNRAVAVLDFGADKVATAQTLTVIFPTADSTNAIMRIT